MEAPLTAPERASHIKPTATIQQEEYMTDRVIYKLNVYEKLSRKHKFRYHFTSLANIILSASVPVLISLGGFDTLTTIMSLVVTILVASEKLFHFREHWRNYDSIAAHLRSEQLLFQTGSGDYTDVKAPETPFKFFVKRVENAILDERNDTIEMRTKEGSND